jgi:hypothetical protein
MTVRSTSSAVNVTADGLVASFASHEKFGTPIGGSVQSVKPLLYLPTQSRREFEQIQEQQERYNRNPALCASPLGYQFTCFEVLLVDLGVKHSVAIGFAPLNYIPVSATSNRSLGSVVDTIALHVDDRQLYLQNLRHTGEKVAMPTCVFACPSGAEPASASCSCFGVAPLQ